MPKFSVQMWREVVETESVTRVIEAVDEDSALEIAQAMASGFNSDCPDDATRSDNVECKSWQVDWDNVLPGGDA